MLYVIPVPVGEAILIVPVSPEQAGCKTEPITGVDGVSGCGLITILAVGNEVQPPNFVNV